jgi:hypothetical protein
LVQIKSGTSPVASLIIEMELFILIKIFLKYLKSIIIYLPIFWSNN